MNGADEIVLSLLFVVPEIQGTTQQVAIAKCKAAAKEVSFAPSESIISRKLSNDHLCALNVLA